MGNNDGDHVEEDHTENDAAYSKNRVRFSGDDSIDGQQHKSDNNGLEQNHILGHSGIAGHFVRLDFKGQLRVNKSFVMPRFVGHLERDDRQRPVQCTSFKEKAIQEVGAHQFTFPERPKPSTPTIRYINKDVCHGGSRRQR